MARSETTPRSAQSNALLAALPEAELAGLLDYLEPVPLLLRHRLSEAGEPISHVYFPLSGVASVLSPSDDAPDVGVEVGLVGREGIIGLSLFLGAERSVVRCMVQLQGQALRMRADDFRAHVGRDSTLHGLLLRYTNTFISQVAISLACNSRHQLEQRFCKWLLMMHARAGDAPLQLTHEFLSSMLGVRRASVTEVARKLKLAGAIAYDRGAITVLNPAQLEASACACYHATQREMDQLLGSLSLAGRGQAR
jgi:CRP-like cAMP-binding protein